VTKGVRKGVRKGVGDRVTDRVVDDSVLHVDGRVGNERGIRLVELLDLVTGLDDGRPSIAFVDVLARIRLATLAEILLVRGPDPGSIALPVRAVVRQPNIRLVVDGADGPGVVLAAPGWVESGRTVRVERVTALTFAEFVTGRDRW
jgi:hypothetical protein